MAKVSNNLWQKCHWQAKYPKSILYLSSVCECDVCVEPNVTHVTHLNISAKWSQIFTKTSAIINIGLGSRLKLFAGACVHARTHSARKRARYFCAFFPTFWCPFFEILKPFQTENEKTEATFRKGIDKTQLFHFINFFPTCSEACVTRINVRACVISFKRCIILGWARKWKMLGTVQCILTVIFALLLSRARAQRPKVWGDLACLTS